MPKSSLNTARTSTVLLIASLLHRFLPKLLESVELIQPQEDFRRALRHMLPKL